MIDEDSYFKEQSRKWDEIWPHPCPPKEPVYPLGKIPLFNHLDIYAEKNPGKRLYHLLWKENKLWRDG
ncbi:MULTISPECIES: hypothetical protein [Archaeoglobus]|uniref:hypothetical protein n=1 Tax=Archaeoglobus TaxID=2233 RepID=UPI00130546CC|nr:MULTISPECIES: hypothetical protein [Archaeoglobus]